MTVLAVVAVALACGLWLRPLPSARLRDPLPGTAVAARHPRLRRVLWSSAAVALPGVAAGAVWGPAGACIGIAVVLPLLTASLVWRRHRARAAELRCRQEVFGACQLLAGLLRVGHVPSAALGIAARDAPVLAEAAAMQGIGAPVAPVLRRLGAAPGCSGLVELGVAWEVAERTGASLTATLEALADRLAAGRAVQNVIASELSAPRATGRLLAVLPLAGLVLGYGFGGDPLAFLVGSPVGQLSLVVGVALACAGVLWTERIAGSGGD